MILRSRHRSTASKHKSNMKDILEGVVVGCIADNNRIVHKIIKFLKDREPPRLSNLAGIFLALLSLPKTYVERTVMQEDAGSGLFKKKRESTPTVCLWGMERGARPF